MRVLLKPKQRDEEGVVAVMVAILCVVLIMMAAFVTDFGLAYTNKRQAQTAADAGALAAARVYADAKAKCSAPNGSIIGGSLSAAQTEAEAIRAMNMPDSKTGTLTAVCDADGRIRVDYTVQSDSPLIFGKLATDDDSILVERTAAAKWGTSEKAVGSLRPWMICGSEVPPGPPFAPKVTQVYMPDGGHSPPVAGACTPDKSGGWWKTSCYNAGGSHGDTVQNILTGCDQVTLAPLSTPPPSTPAALGNALLRDCNTSPSLDKNGPWVESTYCLADDNGNDSSNSVVAAWETLLGQTVAMPVFCDEPQCSPTSVPDGTKSLWPIWKLAAVTICGFDMKGNIGNQTSTLPTGDCNNLNTDHLTPTVFDNASNHNKGMGFLVIFRGLIENGGLTSFPVEVETTMRLVK
jgi:Flp pilus assembly protein TadG